MCPFGSSAGIQPTVLVYRQHRILVKNVLPSWLCPLAIHSEDISVVISDLPECLVLTLAEFTPALLHSFSLIFLGLIAF